MSLQQDIDRITDILRRDDGISGAMHYTEQISWILFLKFLDDLEHEKENEAILTGIPWTPILPLEYRWSTWACPKTPEGKPNLNLTATGDDLTAFVNDTLFPYLKAFSDTENTDTFQYKIGAIFQFLDNRIVSGHTLREVLDIVDKLHFQSETELFELSLVYEHLLQNMGDAGGYAGEFYTPRALVKAIVAVMDAQPGQTIYDGAAGSCGFLVENFEHFKNRKNELTTGQWQTIQTQTFYGIEKTSLAYVMGMMNMILHGIESPNLYRANTLTKNIRDIGEFERYDLIFSNPPFGGKEKSQIQQNFPIASNATELLFLQHFMRSLRQGGKAAIVVPEGILFQTGNAFAQVKQELLENFDLHTILSLPSGVFLPYSAVKTNVLFFNRTGRTRDIWYYECVPEQKLTKNRPLTQAHLADFVARFKTRDTTNVSWTVSVDELPGNYDLTARNPARQNATVHRTPSDILLAIRDKEKRIGDLFDEIETLLQER